MQGRLLPSQKITGSRAFEEAHAAYPTRDRSDPKRPSLRAWSRAVKSGADEQEMVQAAKNYADYCRRRGIEFTPYVMQMARFYGPDAYWRETFTVIEVTPTIRRWKPPVAERPDVPAGFLTGLLRQAIQR